MYERENEDGVKITFNPRLPARAEQAMKDVQGTGVPDTHTLPDDANVPLDEDTARKVHERYVELATRFMRLTLDDGKAPSGGTEPVTVEVVDGDGAGWDDQTYTVVLALNDGGAGTYEVSVSGGSTTIDLPVDQPAGTTLSVQAVEALELDTNDYSKESDKKRIEVV